MTAALPEHKTKIVATVGPASESPEMLVRLIRAGVNVARLNFSHGDFSHHAEVSRRIREAACQFAEKQCSARRILSVLPVWMWGRLSSRQARLLAGLGSASYGLINLQLPALRCRRFRLPGPFSG